MGQSDGFHKTEDLESAIIFIEKHFAVNNLVEYNEHLIFSMHKSLYVLGMPGSLHTFSQPITGLATVDFDLLDELKGKASVRRGITHKRVALLQMVA